MGKQKSGYINQHIVPVSYLNRFASTGDKRHQIGVWQKDLKHYVTSTNNVGYIKNYYDDPLMEDVKHWEHYYDKNIEAPCTTPMNNLVAKVCLSRPNVIILTDNDKQILSKFIIAQLLRVPEFIDGQINSAKANIPQYKKEILSDIWGFLTPEQKKVADKIILTDAQIKNFILSYINNDEVFEKYSKLLISKPWYIYVNKQYKWFPFITSDNPVIMANLLNKSYDRKDNGIYNENTIMYFPINYWIAIGIYPKHFKPYLYDYENRVIELGKEDMNFIYYMNMIEINHCHHQAFFPLFFYNQIYKEREGMIK